MIDCISRIPNIRDNAILFIYLILNMIKNYYIIVLQAQVTPSWGYTQIGGLINNYNEGTYICSHFLDNNKSPKDNADTIHI